MPYMTKGLGLSLNRRNQSRRKQKRNTTFHYSHEPWYSGIWYSSLTSAVASLTERFYSNNSLMQGCCNHYVVTSTKQRKQQTVVTVCNKSKTKLSLANSAKITKPNQRRQKRKLELKYIKILIKVQLFRLALKLPELG